MIGDDFVGAGDDLAQTANEGALVLEADQLSKRFRIGRSHSVWAVRDLSLRLYRGRVVGLVGESGSGKSTVARLLAGQEQPTSGSIRLDGRPAETRKSSAFRRYKNQVQLIFQDPFASLNPVHTVRYHLERPVRLHQQRRASAEVQAELVTLMEQVRLAPAEQFLAKYPHELSGGQRQRVAVARALAARPEVLLADEPVSMLDVSIRLEMLNLLDELRKKYRLALLYITHDIASARYFADDIAVMYAGRVVERGPAEEVTQSPAHPYTQLLVSSAPDPDDLGSILRNGGRVGVTREPSTAVDMVGCAFYLRCPFAIERCAHEIPPLGPINGDREAACWRVDVAAPSVVGAESGGDGAQ